MQNSSIKVSENGSDFEETFKLCITFDEWVDNKIIC